MTRSLDLCRDEWRDLVEVQMRQAEEACHGVLLNREHLWEFRSRFGVSQATVQRMLFRSAAHIAERYASEELLRWWAYNPRVTFEQYAWNAGFRHKFLRQANRRRNLSGSRSWAA